MRKTGQWLKKGGEAVFGGVASFFAILAAVVESYERPQIDRQVSVHYLKRHPDVAVVIFCLFFIVLVAFVDFLSGLRISFALFYLLIAIFAAWNGTRKAGLLVALVSSFAWFIGESNRGSTRGILYWNFVVQAGISILVVLLVSALRSLTRHLEQRVRDRTRALELEIGERKQTEEQLLKTMQQLRQLAENISDAFWMRDSEETRMVYASPAYEKIWGRSCRELYQSSGAWLAAIHPEDRESIRQAILTKQTCGEYNQEYRIVRPDGSFRWIRDRAFPIRDGSGKVIRIVGIAEDVTDRRRLEREVLEISDREKARIGQDLHDGLCQQLVSLGFDSHALEQQLSSHDSTRAAAANKIGLALDDAITEARALARGLFPVQLETDGLTVALQQLAAGVSARSGITCRLECPQPVLLGDNVLATHLYRIAQEAVNNAVKHSRATSMVIELTSRQHRLELKISDNGTGFVFPLRSPTGMGLHIMNYRARAIGGLLSIEPALRRGIVVFCSAPQPPT